MPALIACVAPCGSSNSCRALTHWLQQASGIGCLLQREVVGRLVSWAADMGDACMLACWLARGLAGLLDDYGWSALCKLDVGKGRGPSKRVSV
jgi:hypothetical protein